MDMLKVRTGSSKGYIFYIIFKEKYFVKNELLEINSSTLKVLKVIPNNLWRRFLVKLGFPNRIGWTKVIIIE